jgi:repressor LexA
MPKRSPAPGPQPMRLTERQKSVYEFIRELVQGRGYGPTVREIAEHFQISSPNGVVCHLNALVKKNLIRREANKARAIMLTQEPPTRQTVDASEKGLPFAGYVAAGFTNRAFELNERIDFGEMFHGEDFFALRVRGDSMIEAQIADGDYVICRSSMTAERGQMVVALNDDDEATLKYWFPERGRIRLQPANSAMEPIYLTSAHVRGIVVGVVRSRTYRA